MKNNWSILKGERVWFISFPRSGSNWLIYMLGESFDIDWTLLSERYFRKDHDALVVLGRNAGENKLIYMYRHPKDAILSCTRYMHDQEVIHKDYEGKFDPERIKQLIGKAEMIEWWKKLMTFYLGDSMVNDSRYYLLKYENILLTPEREVREVLKFLEIGVEPKVEKYLTDPLPMIRLQEHTRKYERDENWTKEIDDMINKQLGIFMAKYGYER